VKLDALPFQDFRDIDGKLPYLSEDTYDESLDGEKRSFYRGTSIFHHQISQSFQTISV